MRKTLFWIAVIVIPLAVGLAIYLLFRPTAVVSIALYDFFNINPLSIKTPENIFWILIRYYFCDFLWAFSLTALVKLILGKGKLQSIIALLIVIPVCLFVELFQMCGLIPGTFDVLDLLAETIGTILSLIITITYSRRKANEKQIA